MEHMLQSSQYLRWDTSTRRRFCHGYFGFFIARS